MDPAELNKLKVVDLRKMCQDRGLDQKGVKAVLVERLAEALGSDGNGSSEGIVLYFTMITMESQVQFVDSVLSSRVFPPSSQD